MDGCDNNKEEDKSNLPVTEVGGVNHHLVDISDVNGESFPRRVMIVDAEVPRQLQRHIIAHETETSCSERVVYQTRSVAGRQYLHHRRKNIVSLP